MRGQGHVGLSALSARGCWEPELLSAAKAVTQSTGAPRCPAEKPLGVSGHVEGQGLCRAHGGHSWPAPRPSPRSPRSAPPPPSPMPARGPALPSRALLPSSPHRWLGATWGSFPLPPFSPSTYSALGTGSAAGTSDAGKTSSLTAWDAAPPGEEGTISRWGGHRGRDAPVHNSEGGASLERG